VIHHPATAEFATMVRKSFLQQGLMAHLGAQLSTIQPGFVEIRLAHQTTLLQQHGLFHGGATSAILDSAGGYAAFSLFEPGDEILTVEYKVNFIAPAIGDEIVAQGEVVKSGKQLSVTRGEAYVTKDGQKTTCAVMQQTLTRMIQGSNGKNSSKTSDLKSLK
tara:strand:- start:1096 stop:1581 length:486 start_codon:yes stop_codon:yes gene_type:complete